ncbi:DMT family transporter [Roseibium sp.]|uniref:DMT family transporter n=1 Tax=Roseibium sp. TaxID=1936156 RepID=UPI002630469E|nr:DMT family transporter [Roseibium sp.]
MTGNWVLFFEGIHRTGIAVATILFHIQPFFVVALGAVIFLERLHPVALLWICLALAGLTLSSGLTDAEISGNASALIGIACTLAAAFFYALVTVIAKGLTSIKASQLALVQCICGVLMLFAVTPLTPTSLGPGQWIWLAVIGIVHTGGVYVILYNALPKLSTPVIAVLLFLYPATAVVVDALAYGHLISRLQLGGLLLIMVASLGVTLRWGMREKQITLA